MAMHTFVLKFPGQVPLNCWLLGATGMRTLQGLYHSIPLSERIPTHPLPTLSEPLVEMLSKPLYLSSPGKYFQIVGYWVLQAYGHSETYTIRFPSARGIQPTLLGHFRPAGLRVIHTFVLLFSGPVLSNC